MDDRGQTLCAPHGAAPEAAYARVRAALERPAALVLLLLASPVLGGLGLLLKWESPGPVLYSQTRLGRCGRLFRIYKLRTMTHRCEASTGPVWSREGDPRITRVGKWLRDTHLDELPQLWNVARGEMSLIGPRPERPEIAAQIERAMPEFRERLAVRPGMTGLAQVCLAADADLNTVQRKLAHDLAYVAAMGPGLDARIGAATVLHLVGRAASSLGRRLVRRHAPTPAAFPVRVSERGVVAVVGGTEGLSKAA